METEGLTLLTFVKQLLDLAQTDAGAPVIAATIATWVMAKLRGTGLIGKLAKKLKLKLTGARIYIWVIAISILGLLGIDYASPKFAFDLTSWQAWAQVLMSLVYATKLNEFFKHVVFGRSQVN